MLRDPSLAKRCVTEARIRCVVSMVEKVSAFHEVANRNLNVFPAPRAGERDALHIDALHGKFNVHSLLHATKSEGRTGWG